MTIGSKHMWGCFGLAALVVVTSSNVWASRPLALVYKGQGSCGGSDDCSGAAAEVAIRAGYEIQYVSSSDVNEDLFKDATVWIQPGGNAITVAKMLGHEKLQMIRDFIEAGGGYLGFCAGGFLADHTVDDANTIEGLGIIPVETADFDGDKGDNGTIIPIHWKGDLRDVFFNGGGYFKVPHAGKRGVRVMATYENGQVASIETKFGAGHVAVSGFHPEATDDWKSYAVGTDRDGSDLDIAEELFDWATGQ